MQVINIVRVDPEVASIMCIVLDYRGNTTHVMKEGCVAVEGDIIVLCLLHAPLVTVSSPATCAPSSSILLR